MFLATDLWTFPRGGNHSRRSRPGSLLLARAPRYARRSSCRSGLRVGAQNELASSFVPQAPRRKRARQGAPLRTDRRLLGRRNQPRRSPPLRETEFGGLERVKEEVRDARWETHIDNLLRDFRYALGDFRKDLQFTLVALVAVFALAIGIGGSTVVFSAFYNLVFNAFAAQDSSRLVVPVMQDGSQVYCQLSDIKFDPREQNHSFENVIGYT
jgi:hypothetical protein